MGQSPNGACYTDNPNDAVLVQGNADLKDGWVFPRVWTTEITKTAKAGDLIMSVRAPVGAMGKTAYDVVLGRGVAGIAGNEFLFQALSKKEAEGYWSTVSAGSTFDSINGDELRNTPVDYPRSKPEREAVGSCLSRIDCLITLHQRKCEYRSLCGYLSWEQRKLNQFIYVTSEKNVDGAFVRGDVLSVSREEGVVNQIEFQGRSFAGADVSVYGILRHGDIVYTKSPLRANPYGIIKTNKGRSGIVSTLYATYRARPGVDSDFIQCYFDQDARLNNYLHPLVNKGAKNDMKVSAENAITGNVCFPGCEEQRLISSLFDRLDNLITLHQ